MGNWFSNTCERESATTENTEQAGARLETLSREINQLQTDIQAHIRFLQGEILEVRSTLEDYRTPLRNYPQDDNRHNRYRQRTAVSPPLSEKLQKLQAMRNTTKEGENCSICMQGFPVTDPATVLDCFHLFHLQCILQWAYENNSCPLCRAKLA